MIIRKHYSNNNSIVSAKLSSVFELTNQVKVVMYNKVLQNSVANVVR